MIHHLFNEELDLHYDAIQYLFGGMQNLVFDALFILWELDFHYDALFNRRGAEFTFWCTFYLEEARFSL